MPDHWRLHAFCQDALAPHRVAQGCDPVVGREVGELEEARAIHEQVEGVPAHQHAAGAVDRERDEVRSFRVGLLDALEQLLPELRLHIVLADREQHRATGFEAELAVELDFASEGIGRLAHQPLWHDLE